MFHVYARGNNKQLIYLSDSDRVLYLSMLGRIVRKQEWRMLGFCLMPNHVHLLVETPEPNLGDGMRRLHGDYAYRFNKEHGRCGHVFQGRFGAKRVKNNAQLLMVARYIALNPVEAQLCATAEDWRWGSHRHVMARHARNGWLDVQRLLEFFEVWGGDPHRRYAELVAAG